MRGEEAPVSAMMPALLSRGRRLATAAAVLLVMAGRPACGPAWAQAAPPADSEQFDLLRALQLKGKVAPASDFVTQSRPAGEQAFIPVHTPHTDRPEKVMTAAELAATTADLDGARERQQRRAGKVPPVVPLKQPQHAKITPR